MDTNLLIDGLVMFISFVGLVCLHEYAHAWMATRCGDDTPRLQGRLTLDPMSHIDLVGTIILPLVITFAGAVSGRPMLFGWGKPVMVNLSRFRKRRRDDILVSGAGPAMNFIAAIGILALAKGLELAGMTSFRSEAWEIARLSMFLCFFNLLPVPPLDGGHIMRNLIGISDESYMALSRYSFIFFIVIVQVPEIGMMVSRIADGMFLTVARPFGWDLVIG